MLTTLAFSGLQAPDSPSLVFLEFLLTLLAAIQVASRPGRDLLAGSRQLLLSRHTCYL